MSELVVIGFDTPHEADRVLTEMARLRKEYLIDLEDAVVAIRDPDGNVRIKQSINLVGIGAAQGGLSGALWGSLVGHKYSQLLKRPYKIKYYFQYFTLTSH